MTTTSNIDGAESIYKSPAVLVLDYNSSLFPQLFRLLSEVYSSKITQADLESNYLDQDHQILLASLNDTIVGCAFISFNKDYIRNRKTSFVSYVAVDNGYRRQGIGSCLFSEIEKRSRIMSCTAIELTSADYRDSAHAFYHSLDFTKKKTTVFIKEL